MGLVRLRSLFQVLGCYFGFSSSGVVILTPEPCNDNSLFSPLCGAWSIIQKTCFAEVPGQDVPELFEGVVSPVVGNKNLSVSCRIIEFIRIIGTIVQAWSTGIMRIHVSSESSLE